MPAAKTLLIPALLASSLTMALAGCNSSKVSNCPPVAILADTAQVTQFRVGAVQDLSGEAYTAYLTGISTDCYVDKRRGMTNSSVILSFRATRAPTSEAAEYTIPYFLAVIAGERVLTKQIFTVTFRFAPGASVANFTDTVDETDIKIEADHRPTDYQLTAGLQISEAQQAYNKKRGAYTP